MHPANERQHYNLTLSLIGWPHTQNYHCMHIYGAFVTILYVKINLKVWLSMISKSTFMSTSIFYMDRFFIIECFCFHFSHIEACCINALTVVKKNTMFCILCRKDILLCLPINIVWYHCNMVNFIQNYYNMVQCHYNMVNFLTNIFKRHPIPHLLGQGMGVFWGYNLWLIFYPSSCNYLYSILLYWTVL